MRSPAFAGLLLYSDTDFLKMQTKEVSHAHYHFTSEENED